MLEINKNYIFDENQQPIAVQIPIAEFEKIEESLEGYGLAKLMEEAQRYYQSLKGNHVES